MSVVSSLKPTPSKIRYLRLKILILSGGTTILRELLESIIYPKELSEVLNAGPVLKRLQNLRRKGILFDNEWQLLYSGASCQPDSLDITLIVKLLRQDVICGLIPPRTGWKKLPNNADLSLEADIVRINYYRNVISHINEKMEIRKPEFHDYWTQVTDALLRIVEYFSPNGSPLVEEWKKVYEELLNCPLDADEDQERPSFCNHVKQVFSLRCVIKLASVGAWLGGTLYVLNRLKNNADILANLVECVFPDGISVIRTEFGSIKLQLCARDLLAMEELRKRYESGQLKKDLEKFMVTEELKHLANEPVEFDIEVDEDEYLLAHQYLCNNQETADDTPYKKEREEEEDNLKEINAQETVSLKEEEDNLKEINAQETVSLKEEDNARETVSLKEEKDETTSEQETTTNTLTFGKPEGRNYGHGINKMLKTVMATGTPAPGDVLQASEGKTRFVRLARLLVCGGTTVMRELFDYIIPPANLAAVLSSPPVKIRLTDMKNKRILTSPQWQKLYPPSSARSAQSTSFDITLLFKLLRENMISGLSAPNTGWDELPNIGDLSLPANMARIKYFQNCIAHHKKMELSEQEFSDYWKEIKDALVRIVGHYATSGSSTVTDWETAIDGLRTNPLTEDDRRNVEELSAEELKSYYLESRLETLLKVEKKEISKNEKFQQAMSVLKNLIVKIRLWLPIRESSMKLMRETADELDVIQRKVDSETFYWSSVGVGGVISIGVGAVACFFTSGLATPFIAGGVAAAAGGGTVSYEARMEWLKENEIHLNRVKDVLENDCAEQQEVSREVQTLQDLTKQISQEENIDEEEALKNLLIMFNDRDNNGAEYANLNVMLYLKKDLIDTINSVVVTLRAVAEISKIWTSLNDAEARGARIKDFLPILAAISVFQFVTSASSYLTGSKSQYAQKLRETVNKLDDELQKHKDFLINFLD